MTPRNQRWLSYGRRTVASPKESGTLSALNQPHTRPSIAPTGALDLDRDGDEKSMRTGPLGLNQLNHATEPQVEVVFVHGLGGGSRKSWSTSSPEAHFWPGSWLPHDPDFRNVRFHSFGYKSSKSEVVKAISGIPEYAQSLLNALSDSPCIRQSKNAIILVGHSMGGLVIKKAFIQAHAIAAYKDLRNRMQCLYFLGTPHQGSEFIETFVRYFKRIPFLLPTENIKDLDPASRLVESLNQEFPRCSQEIELRSFWEMRQSKIFTTNRFIVPKHSACLNYINEISEGLDADHRRICKFEKKTDPNYQKLRDALAASVDDLVQRQAVQNDNRHIESLRILREYLEVNDPPEDDLTHRLQACVSDDSCAWFTTGKTFKDWLELPKIGTDSESELCNFIIMEGEAGVGKSVLSAQIIRTLQALDHECGYYFFDAHDRAKASLSGLLRSLAFQMAISRPDIRHSILKLREQRISIHNEDPKYIWRKLFTTCILQLHPDKQYFWIIDGLDECHQPEVLLRMLSGMTSDAQLKIFLTSRPRVSTPSQTSADLKQISYLQLSRTDTEASIKAYIEVRASKLRLGKGQDQHDVVKALLEAAQGSFLWAKLTLDNMGEATGPQQVMNTLELVPKGMDDLYSRILKDLECSIRDGQKPVLQAVLDWVMCADPPLTVEELETAVKLDTSSDIFADKISAMLRNLVFIDSNSRIRPIHHSARSFLLRPDLDLPFVVDAAKAHAKIAAILMHDLHRRLRNTRNSSQLDFWHQSRQGLDSYALLYFSDHLRRAKSNDHTLLLKTERFFTRNGLSWVACIALLGSLNPIIETSKALQSWLSAYARCTSPRRDLATATARLQQWSVDLSRVVAKYGRHLLECPYAVHMLIPPFVPTDSVLAVSRPRARDLSVTGTNIATWDDRLCSKFFQESICATVASGRYNFAVAMKNGTIFIYDQNTMELLKTLYHGAIVKLMKYDDTGTYLLSTGFRKMIMWTIPEGRKLWDQMIREPRLAAEFVEEGVLHTISSQHKLIKQSITNGDLLKVIEKTDSPSDKAKANRLFRPELQYAEFSRDAEMLATMQRERSIRLTDIEDRYDIGAIEMDLRDDGHYEDTEQPITAMTFCANIDIALLAVVYRDGTLAVFNRDLRLQAKRADTGGSTLLAGSPTGSYLAVANVEGVITLYDFEQLTTIHTLYTKSVENIRALVFSADGQRIIDVRDRQANIWAPVALINQSTEIVVDDFEQPRIPTNTTSHVAESKDYIPDIACILTCPNADQVFVGREDGAIILHSTKDSKQMQLLSQDPGKQWTADLTWKTNNRILGSLNGASTIAMHRLDMTWNASTIFCHTFQHPVKQFFINDRDGPLRLFVVTTKTIDLLISDLNENDAQRTEHRQSHDVQNQGLWVEDFSGNLILVEPNKISTFGWDDIQVPKAVQQLSFPNLHDYDPTENQPGTAEIATFDRGSSLSPGGRPMLFLRSVSLPNTTLTTPRAAMPTGSPSQKRWLIDLSACDVVYPSQY